MQLLNSQEEKESNNVTGAAFLAGKICLLTSYHNGWVIDSVASMCSDVSLFDPSTLVKSTTNITIPDGSRIPVTHIGEVHLMMRITLKYVLYAPSFKFNLTSAFLAANAMGCIV